MRFHWKDGFPDRGVDASTVGSEILRLMRANSQRIWPAALVQAAAQEASPLHDLFTWDNRAAAEAFRLSEARGLLRALVQYVDQGGQPVPTRAFVRVATDDSSFADEGAPLRVYVRVTDAMSDPVLRARVLETAMRELRVWHDRYRRYRRLGRIVTAVGRILAEHKHAEAPA